MKVEQQQRLYDALKRITQYDTPTRLKKDSRGDWGLDYEEALEMSYENIQEEAKSALKGIKRPI